MATRNSTVAAGIIGASALVGLVAVAIGVTAQGTQIDTAKSSIVSFTAPPSTPTVTVAVPAHTGPAPLFAGEAPNANPQGGH